MRDRKKVSVLTAQMMISCPVTDFLSLGSSKEPEDTQRESLCAAARAIK